MFLGTSVFCLDALTCNWSNWTIFSTCSHSCGGGTKYRTRNCQNTNPLRENWLPKTETDIQSCNTEICQGKTDFRRHTLIFKLKTHRLVKVKVKSMHRSGTEAIMTQIQPSKPKWEILQIIKIQREHMANRLSSYFPKGGHSAT